MAIGDLQRAGTFRAYYQNHVRYVHEEDVWMVWRGNKWDRARNDEVSKMAQDLYAKEMAKAQRIEDPDKRKEAEERALGFTSEDHVQKLLVMARRESPIATSPEDWEPHPLEIPFLNGVYDLRTDKFSPHASNKLIRRTLTVKYNPGAVKPVKFLGVLEDLFCGEGKWIEAAHKMAGYCLTGLANEEVFFVLVGKPRCGKSLFTDTLGALMGDLGMKFMDGSLEGGGNRQKYDWAGLVGRRLAQYSEPNKQAKLAEASLKSLTGDAEFVVREIYGKPKTIRNQAKLIISSNFLPQIVDASGAMEERMFVLLAKADQRPVEKRDLGLKGHILREELEGVALWALEGARKVLREGLGRIPHTREEKEFIALRTSPLGDFVGEVLEPDPNGWIYQKDVWESYLTWCEASGIRQLRRLQKPDFFDYMRKLCGKTKERHGGRAGFEGVRFKEERIREEEFQQAEEGINKTFGGKRV